MRVAAPAIFAKRVYWLTILPKEGVPVQKGRGLGLSLTYYTGLQSPGPSTSSLRCVLALINMYKKESTYQEMYSIANKSSTKVQIKS